MQTPPEPTEVFAGSTKILDSFRGGRQRSKPVFTPHTELLMMTRYAGLMVAAQLLWMAGCGKPPGAVPRIDESQARALYLTLLSGEGEAADAGPAQERTGWATITGRFRLQGDPPAPRQLVVNRDMAVCAPGGRAVFSEAVRVDGSGNLANAVIFARDLSGDNVHSESRGDTGEVEFDQLECIFLSRVKVMQVTQRLKILNSDPVAHNTKIDPRVGTPYNRTIGPNGSDVYQPTAAEAQPAPVSCSIHPWMAAFLLPLDNAYGAASEDDGTFEIANLPAGIDLEFQLWHESAGNLARAVINGEETSLSRGRMSLRLDPDETRTLEIVIPAETLR